MRKRQRERYENGLECLRAAGIILILIVITGLMTGCATSEEVAKSLGGKNVSGSGLITDNRIGIDPETKTPVLKSVVISGDLQTIKSDSNYINYKNETSGAWYNASNKTTKQTLTITTNNKSSLAEVLKYAIGVIDKLPQETDTDMKKE
jgi:hypothetical protein